MKSEKDEFELLNGMNEDEFDEFMQYLNKYSVPLPNENMIDSTVDVLKNYIPCRKNTFKNAVESIVNFSRRSLVEMVFMDKGYLIINLILYIAAYFVIRHEKMSPYMIIMILSPLPFILGVMNIVRNKAGMYEIEYVCKTSIAEVLFSKFVIILTFNIILNIFITFTAVGTAQFSKEVLMCFTSLACMSGAALFVLRKFRSGYALASLMILWIFGIYMLFYNDNIDETFIRANNIFYTGIILAGITNVIVQMKKIMKLLYEGGGFVEFNS